MVGISAAWRLFCWEPSPRRSVDNVRVRHACGNDSPPPAPSPIDGWYERWFAHWQGEIRAVGRRSPAIDPDSGRVDEPRLRAVVQELVKALPALPEDAGDGQVRLHDKLVDALRSVVGADGDAAPPRQRALEVRDAFATAARRARRLARRLDPPWPTRQARDPAAATAYRSVAALFTELKRAHLAAGAVDLIRHWAGREAENLARAGFHARSPGDTLNTGGGFDISLDTGAFGVGGGIKRNRMLFVDDDDNAYAVDMLARHIEGGLGSRLGAWKARLGGRLGVQEGGVLSRVDSVELAQLILNHDANRAWIKSAGPRTRKALARLDGATSKAARGIGKHYARTPGAPTYLDDRKLAKGFNRTKIEVIAASLDRQLGGERFGKLMAEAYPAAAQLLGQRLKEGRPAPKDLLHEAVPVSNVYESGLSGYRQTAWSVEGRLGRGGDDEPGLPASLGVSLGMSYGKLNFFFWIARAAHELLDTGNCKDPRQVLELHRQIDTIAAGTAPPPHLHLYNQVRQQLGGGGTGIEPVLDAEARTRYGDASTIPAQFREDLARPDGDKLDQAAVACRQIVGVALALHKHGPRLLARPDRFLPAAERAALHAARTASFDVLAEQVWNGAYPGGLEAALDDPEAFVARSHDALSLALGCAGTHRDILAERLDGDPASAVCIAQAGAAYRDARTLLDAIGHLSLTRRQVTDRHASLRAQALFERHDFGFKASAAARLKSLVMPRLGEPTGAGMDLVSQSGQVDFSVEMKYLYANRQIKACRLGHFLQLTFAARSGVPLLGEAIARTAMKALEKKFPGTRAEAMVFDLRDAVRQLQKMVLNVEAGASVVVKLRKPLGMRGGYELQYVRGFATVAGGIGATLMVPTPLGLLQVGGHTGSSAQSCRFMLLGADPGKLIMQWPKLKAFVAREGPDLSLKQLFDGHPRMANAYFGLADLVPTVIERRLASDAALDAGGEPPNEFFRYRAQAPFLRARQVSGVAQQHAPGSSVLPDGLDWERAKAEIARLDTVQQRIDYFCGEGRKVFDAFLATVGDATDAHGAVLQHVAWREDGFTVRLSNGLAPERGLHSNK